MKWLKKFVIFSVSLFCISSGVVLILYTDISECIVDYILQLRPGSYRDHSWKHVSSVVDHYFFNWTNPQAIYNTSSKPTFEEVGPYRFSEERQKTDIVWNNNGTVTYRDLKWWTFSGDRSDQKLDKSVIVPNPTTLSAAYKSRFWGYAARRGLSFSLSTLKSSVYMEQTPNRLFFEGYHDSLISLTNSLVSKQSMLPRNYFGWMYQQNGSSTYYGTYNVGTRTISNAGTYKKLGKLYSWNYQTYTPAFGSYCSDINGSVSEIFEPPLRKTTITLFLSEICRTITLQYSKDVKVYGILGYKYVLEDLTLDNGNNHPKNKCFCNGECIPSGVLNTTTCKHGCPVFFSLPHFYKADPYYLNSINGLKPTKKKHEWYIIIEPVTGTILESVTRFQVNLLLQPIIGITLYENIPKLLIPVFWYDRKESLPKERIFKLRLILNTPAICLVTGVILVIIGFAALTYLIFGLFTPKTKDKDKIYQDEIIPLEVIRS